MASTVRGEALSNDLPRSFSRFLFACTNPSASYVTSPKQCLTMKCVCFALWPALRTCFVLVSVVSTLSTKALSSLLGSWQTSSRMDKMPPEGLSKVSR